METPTETTEARRLLALHVRLIDLGYPADEYLVAHVAMQFADGDRPTDGELQAAVGRAQVVGALQRSFA